MLECCSNQTSRSKVYLSQESMQERKFYLFSVSLSSLNNMLHCILLFFSLPFCSKQQKQIAKRGLNCSLVCCCRWLILCKLNKSKSNSNNYYTASNNNKDSRDMNSQTGAFSASPFYFSAFLAKEWQFSGVRILSFCVCWLLSSSLSS